MFWGISEALDLLAEYKQHVYDEQAANPHFQPPNELNILLYGASDPRHILTTLAAVRIAAANEPPAAYNPTIHFHLLDGCTEIIARNILLLNIALEPPTAQLSLKARTTMFMDLYGNALLRPSSHQYMSAKARAYIACVTDPDGPNADRLMPHIDLSRLKYRERDALLDAFTFWQPRAAHRCEMQRYWEQRVRHDLGTRYDHRAGCFDWDLQMRLRDNGVQRVCGQEYKHWRETGVAFAYPEFEQTWSNKTMVAGLCGKGEGGADGAVAFVHRGYAGDIRTGPFVTFGERCKDVAMTKCEHGTNRYRATDITERNVMGLMYEIREGRPYVHDVGHSREFGGSVLQLGKHLCATEAAKHEVDAGCFGDAGSLDGGQFDGACLRLENGFRVTMMSPGDVLNVGRGAGHEGVFDVVFVGHNYYAFLKKDFGKVFRRSTGALVVFETKQNLVLRRNEVEEFLGKVRTFGRDSQLRAVTKWSVNTPKPLVRFVAFDGDEGEGGDSLVGEGELVQENNEGFEKVQGTAD